MSPRSRPRAENRSVRLHRWRHSRPPLPSRPSRSAPRPARPGRPAFTMRCPVSDLGIRGSAHALLAAFLGPCVRQGAGEAQAVLLPWHPLAHMARFRPARCAIAPVAHPPAPKGGLPGSPAAANRGWGSVGRDGFDSPASTLLPHPEAVRPLLAAGRCLVGPDKFPRPRASMRDIGANPRSRQDAWRVFYHPARPGRALPPRRRGCEAGVS